jgi:glycosyltransferase involved in cell wall biosynthesis
MHGAQGCAAACVEGVLAQGMADFELLCVDDCSEDGTLGVLEGFDEPRLRIIRRGKRGGAGAARNDGLRAAKGDYILFLDADDSLEPDFFAAALEEIERSNADVLVFDFYRQDVRTGKKKLCHGINRSLLPAEMPFCRRNVPRDICTIAIPTPWNKLLRRGFLLEKNLRFQEISSTNDVFFSAACMLEARRIAYLPRAFVNYRTNQSCSITAGKGKRLGNVRAAVEALLSFAARRGYDLEHKEALRYFAANNLLFALDNYAGKPLGRRYRRFYGQIRRFFRSPLFNGAQGNARLARCLAVRKNCYPLHLAKGALRRLRRSHSLRRLRALCSLPRRLWRLLGACEEQLKQGGSRALQSAALAEQTAALRGELAALRGLIDRQDAEERLIVSFTSYPARIERAAEVVLNLLEQSRPPDRIMLWLAREEFPLGEDALPKRLLALCGGLFSIGWTQENMRSYKKLLPALAKYPNDCIVTVDDDLVYRQDMLESLWAAHNKYPRAICGMRGHTMRFGNDGQLLPYADWGIEEPSPVLEPRLDIFLTTGAGTLFPPHSLPAAAADWNTAKRLCPTADDVWFKLMSLRAGTKSLLAQEKRPLRYLPKTQGERLWNLNKNTNDAQIAAFFAHYGQATSE